MSEDIFKIIEMPKPSPMAVRMMSAESVRFLAGLLSPPVNKMFNTSWTGAAA